MTLDKKWFLFVQCGQKVYEVRIWDEKRKQIKIGDTITFTNRETGQTCTKTVVGCTFGFKTFRRIFDTFNYDLVVPGVKNIDQACQIYYDIPGYANGIVEHTAVVYELGYD